jgi:hypothetical protein
VVAQGQPLFRISFVPVAGIAPNNFAQDKLPDPQFVAGEVRTVFEQYLTSDGIFSFFETAERLPAINNGLHLIYVYGHAWLHDKGVMTATRTGTDCHIETGAELLSRLLTGAPEQTILILDCCHAYAFEPCVPVKRPRFVLYASAADEKAIALTTERATRLILALNRFAGRHKLLDLARLTADVREYLDRDDVVRGQRVSYEMHGAEILLSRLRNRIKNKREKTVSRIRNVLVSIGTIFGMSMIVGIWLYRTHTMIEIDLSSISSISHTIKVIVRQELPESNENYVIDKRDIHTDSARLWLPTVDITISVQAEYADQHKRELSSHLKLVPSLNFEHKLIKILLPEKEEILKHPNMAYIPATDWLRGRGLEKARNDRGFWIDLYPPSVSNFLPIAESLAKEGFLVDRQNSFLLTAKDSDSVVLAQATTSVGGDRDTWQRLGIAMAKQSSASSIEMPQSGSMEINDVVFESSEIPCDECPAPMTYYEAKQFCAWRNMHLPSADQWELAIRGVDGRLYPYGNQPDKTRANAPGLPEKVGVASKLAAITAFADFPSPFGLVDTVGNAGDWIRSNSDLSSFRAYGGATYLNNPENAATYEFNGFKADAPFLPNITARCVDETTPD